MDTGRNVGRAMGGHVGGRGRVRARQAGVFSDAGEAGAFDREVDFGAESREASRRVDGVVRGRPHGDGGGRQAHLAVGQRELRLVRGQEDSVVVSNCVEELGHLCRGRSDFDPVGVQIVELIHAPEVSEHAGFRHDHGFVEQEREAVLIEEHLLDRAADEARRGVRGLIAQTTRRP